MCRRYQCHGMKLACYYPPSAQHSMSAQPTATDCQLLKAAHQGDHSLVVQLLDQGASPTIRHEPDERTALHAAAAHGSLEVVQELLSRGAAPDARTADGLTPLYVAATLGHFDAAAALVEGKASVDAPDDEGYTPLHAAAGHVSITELLLDNGSAVHAAAANGVTPLMFASRQGELKATALLLEHGAAVEMVAEEGNTALHYACEQGHLEVAAVLLRAKAAITAVNYAGETPLFLASDNGHEQVVRLLLSGGANPYTPNTMGSLPLHMACAGGHTGIVTRLLRGRRTPAHVNALDADNHTPLHVASSQGHTKVVSLLLKAGADVDARSTTQDTPMLVAIRNGHTLVLQQLPAAGADPTARGQDGADGLHVAVSNGQSTTLQVLLPAITAVAGCGVVDAVLEGLTPLHGAVVLGHTDCVKVLLAAGADPDKLYGAEAGVGLAGVSALYRAVQLQRTAIVPLLTTPSNMRSCWEGQTPLHCALALGEAGVGMAQALVAAGSPVGVPNAAGATAMALAAASSIAAVRALLPAMVRNECQLYMQLQQGETCQPQQDGEGEQQQQQPGGGGQQEPAAVLAAVVAAVVQGLLTLFDITADVAPGWCIQQVEGCFKAIMEVLGPGVGGNLLQQVLNAVQGNSMPPEAYRSITLLLCDVLHGVWMADVQPLLQQRHNVTNRFRRLVTEPLHLRTRAGRRKQEPGQQAAYIEAWASAKGRGLVARLTAAAAAGQWQLWVHLLEHLAGVSQARASRGFELSMATPGHPSPVDVLDSLDLCEALLRAWVAVRQDLGRRKQRELADAVVAAVGVWQQQQQAVEPEGGRRKRQRAGRAPGR